MAKSVNRLAARTVDTITKPGRHADGGNLFLVVDPPRTAADGTKLKPARRWAFIFRWNGKLKEMGLGATSAVTLARARDLAAQYRALLAENRNPIEVRKAEQRRQSEGRTFGEVAADLHGSWEGGWRNAKYARQWLVSLETYAKPIWSRPVETIGTDDVLAILKPIWTTKAETASRVRERIEAVLDAAKAKGLIPVDKANPAQWRGHLAHLLPKRPTLQRGHHKALPYAELPEFLTALRRREEEAVSALSLEFTILTTARSNETRGARWPEFDLAAGVWTVPAKRMKGNREHRVPLTDRPLAILRELAKLKSAADCFVFPGQKPGKPLSVMAMTMLLRRMQVAGRATVHGFRSSFRDWAGDCTSFARETVEEALAHRVGNNVERAYRRGDALAKRRELLAAWERYCSGEATANVVPLRSAAS